MHTHQARRYECRVWQKSLQTLSTCVCVCLCTYEKEATNNRVSVSHDIEKRESALSDFSLMPTKHTHTQHTHQMYIEAEKMDAFAFVLQTKHKKGIQHEATHTQKVRKKKHETESPVLL